MSGQEFAFFKPNLDGLTRIRTLDILGFLKE